jgi:hypothetical protein
MNRPANAARLSLMSLEDRTVPAVLDLSTAGTSGAINGALFAQSDPLPTGSMHSFVQLQSWFGGTEEGYNTDARPLQFDELSARKDTHALKLSDVPVVNVGGQTYYQFVLDINQRARRPDISLDELRVFVGGTGDLTGYNPHTHKLAGMSPVYDMDANNNNWVKLNADLNRHRGEGDMNLDVPTSLFQAAGPSSYVYLYSKFGQHFASNGGVEEWGTLTPAATGSISGTITDSATGAALAGVVVFIDSNHDGILNATEQYTRTDSTGHYSFTNLSVSSSYAVRILTTGTASQVAGIDPTTSQVASYFSAPDVVLTAGQAFTLNFGVTVVSQGGGGGLNGGPPPV